MNPRTEASVENLPVNRASTPGAQGTVVYLTRNSLLEPLGQSQVFSYLERLSGDSRIVLVTCEKAPDYADQACIASMRTRCVAAGIDWRPMPFEQGPQLISVMRQTRRFLAEARSLLKNRPLLVHARSYLPSIAALILNRKHGTPFIFDMRALWPEELIMAGRLRRGSVMHRSLLALERRCVKYGEVVSLTEAAVDYLNERYPVETSGKTITVIPTCADLERFKPLNSMEQRMKIGCNGTVLSGWFRLDLLAALYRALAERYPEAELEIVTKDNHAELRSRLIDLRAPVDRVSLKSAQPHEMPAVVQEQTASVMFFKAGLGKIGSCPTRMGEVLGCGRPVIANSGVGDVDRIIRRHNVGVLIDDPSSSAIEDAMSSLERLLADSHLAGRCRSVAEQYFSLEVGEERYGALYRFLHSSGGINQ